MSAPFFNLHARCPNEHEWLIWSDLFSAGVTPESLHAYCGRCGQRGSVYVPDPVPPMGPRLVLRCSNANCLFTYYVTLLPDSQRNGLPLVPQTTEDVLREDRHWWLLPTLDDTKLMRLHARHWTTVQRGSAPA